MRKSRDVMSAMQAADFLGAHVETIRRLARKGAIPAFKVGKDWRFRREALQEWTRSNQIGRDLPTVLVVDDEESIRELVKLILTKAGCEVLQASSGPQALKLLEHARIDLILLDLKMPEMNGPEFLARLKEAGMRIPVVIITGFPDSSMVLEAMGYGPITLLAKPLRRQMLLHAVHAELGESPDSPARIHVEP